jgi:hypothetical protein
MTDDIGTDLREGYEGAFFGPFLTRAARG